MNRIVEEYLKTIDLVIEKGHYKDNWESLGTYPEPEWYRKAKFGIFIHWGVYSVPAFKSEWYPRLMYMKDSEVYNFHREKYGDPGDFGYADFIPLFKAEKFDPLQWASLFKESGARYVMPVAEHHDGFQMYDSRVSDWCASKMGPEKDILGELKKAVETEGMVFSASSHRAENYWFFGGGRTFNSGLKEGYNEPYGWAEPLYPTMNQEETHNIYSAPASKEHLDDWLVRTCELVDRYQPKIVWFDWWIQNMSFKPYLKKFAAYYYNRSLEWQHGVAINYKYDAYALGSGVFDIERGQLAEIRPRLWQNDTAVAKNSWGYTENNDFKNPVDLVCDLVDIASKNGCLLLNIGPKSDGTITEEDQNVLRSIGKWLKVNGEAVYDTTYWHIYGEGPTEIPDGSFTDVSRSSFTSRDIRFTYKTPHVYAHVLSWPRHGKVTINSLGIPSSQKGKGTGTRFMGHVEKIEILGYENSLTFTRDTKGLHIKVEGEIQTDYPVCFKVTID